MSARPFFAWVVVLPMHVADAPPSPASHRDHLGYAVTWFGIGTVAAIGSMRAFRRAKGLAEKMARAAAQEHLGMPPPPYR